MEDALGAYRSSSRASRKSDAGDRSGAADGWGAGDALVALE